MIKTFKQFMNENNVLNEGAINFSFSNASTSSWTGCNQDFVLFDDSEEEGFYDYFNVQKTADSFVKYFESCGFNSNDYDFGGLDFNDEFGIRNDVYKIETYFMRNFEFDNGVRICLCAIPTLRTGYYDGVCFDYEYSISLYTEDEKDFSKKQFTLKGLTAMANVRISGEYLNNLEYKNVSQYFNDKDENWINVNVVNPITDAFKEMVSDFENGVKLSKENFNH